MLVTYASSTDLSMDMCCVFENCLNEFSIYFVVFELKNMSFFCQCVFVRLRDLETRVCVYHVKYHMCFFWDILR